MMYLDQYDSRTKYLSQYDWRLLSGLGQSGAHAYESLVHPGFAVNPGTMMSIPTRRVNYLRTSLSLFDPRGKYLNGMGTTANQLLSVPSLKAGAVTALDPRFRWGLGDGCEKKISALGQDLTPPDIGPLPIPGMPEYGPIVAPITGPPAPPGLPFPIVPSRPVVPVMQQGPLAPPPDLTFRPAMPPALAPSGQVLLPPSPGRQLFAADWWGGQTFPGLSNKALVGTAVGVVILATVMSGKKRRR